MHEIFCKVFLVYFGKAGVDYFKQHKLLCHMGLLLGLQLKILANILQCDSISMNVDPIFSQSWSRQAQTAQTVVSCGTAHETRIVNINQHLSMGLTLNE